VTVQVDWIAFLEVFAVALIAAVLLVGLYSLGLRLLVVAGRPPVVAPAEFTDAITVISPKAAKRAAKAAAKAAKRNPLTEGQKRVALIGAYASFVLCGVAVLCGLVLIVWSSLSHG